MNFFSQYRNWILLFTVLFGFLWNLGNAPLFDEDEGFFAEGTREMELRGDFISTQVNQELRFDKPPLTNWLQYASTKAFGWTEQAMRLPSALAALCWMLAIFYFVKKRLGETEAFYATLMAACSLQITIIGKAAIADAFLNATLAASMFCLYEVLHQKKGPYVFFFYALAGLGFLAKGPIAVLVPGIVTVLYLLRWRSFQPLLRVLNPLGVLLFIAIALPWYWLQYQQLGDQFIQGFFFEHNVNRFKTAFEGHYGGIGYFIPVLLLGVLPYTAVTLSSFSRLKQLWNNSYLSFHLIWFVFVFLFFSLSGTKLHHYIIYGYTALFILGTWYVKQSKRLPIMWPLLILLLILTAAPPLMPYIIPKVDDLFAVAVMEGAAIEFSTNYFVQMGVLIVLTLLIGIKKNWSKDIRLWIAGIILLITINGIWMPRLGKLLQLPVKEAALFAKEKGYRNLVVYDHYYPSFHFYSGLFAEERAPQSGDIVLARNYRLKNRTDFEILYKKYGVLLVKMTK